MDDGESYQSSHDEPIRTSYEKNFGHSSNVRADDTLSGIELPSRIGSRASSKPSRAGTVNRAPTIPRKSSRRTNSRDGSPMVDVTHLSTVAGFSSRYSWKNVYYTSHAGRTASSPGQPSGAVTISALPNCHLPQSAHLDTLRLQASILWEKQQRIRAIGAVRWSRLSQ